MRVLVEGDAAARHLVGGLQGFGSLAAAKEGSRAGEELANAERLCEVVVGAEFEPDDLVYLGVARRKEEDRRGELRADAPAQFVAVDAGKHDVEDEEVEMAVLDLLEGFLSVGGDFGAVPLFLHGVADEFGDGGFVVDDQNASGVVSMVHLPYIRGRVARRRNCT